MTDHAINKGFFVEWHDYPLLRLAVFLAFGIVAAVDVAPYVSSMLLFVIGCVILACMSWCMLRSRNRMQGNNNFLPFGILSFILSFILGMFLYVSRYERMTSCTRVGKAMYEGVVKGIPKEKRKSWMIRIADAERYDVILYVGKDTLHLDEQRALMLAIQEGDTVKALAQHVYPVAIEDEAHRSYAVWLLHSGACATAYVRPSCILFKVADARLSASDINVRTIQRHLHDLYETNDINGDAGDVIEAITIGRKAGLSEHVQEVYSRAGASHLLSLSGFHVGIIMIILQSIMMGQIVDRRWRKFINVASLAFLWLFVLMAGLSASLVRASAMCTVVVACALAGRKVNLLNVCAFAFVVMLCFNPMSLFDVGFQLSFMSVAGIGIYVQLSRMRMPSMRKWLRPVYNTVAISMVCTISTAPLVAYHFGCVSLVAVVSNLFAVVLVYVLLACAFLWWATLCWDAVNDMITLVLAKTTGLLNGLMEYLSSLPFAVIEWHPGALATVGSYLCLIAMVSLFTFSFERRKI